MFRQSPRTLSRLTIELGLKTFTQLDETFVEERLRNGNTPTPLLTALNIKNDAPIEGNLDVSLLLTEDSFKAKPKKRPLKHGATDSDGGITEVLANARDSSAKLKISVSKGKTKRAYALVRQAANWKSGKLGWIRGTLPFEIKLNSLEPMMAKAEDTQDAPTWFRYLLSDFGIHIRHQRHDIATTPPFLFASRCRGSYFLNGHAPDVTAGTTLRFPDGAPILCERQAYVAKNEATYHFDRSFHFECQTFVKQEAESLIAHKENSTKPHQMRSFTITGLKDGVLTFYVPREAITEKKLSIKKVFVYSIQDPTSEEEQLKKMKKRPKALVKNLKWKADKITGAVVVAKVTGAVHVEY